MLNKEEWERNFSGYYQGETVFGALMKEHSSLDIGGPAEVLISPGDPVSVKNIITIAGRRSLPLLVIGGGTNILVRDGGIEGLVVRLNEFKRLEVIEDGTDHVLLFAEAGAMLQTMVNFCRTQGFSGMEGLTGIPGTLGGAICGNAGSFGCEIRDLLVSVIILGRDGSLQRIRTEELGFGYRTSGIHAGDLVLSANLRLGKDRPENVAARTDEFFSRKKTSQPIWEKSAGCVFRNPEGMSAGRMLDEAGCKGMRAGGIEVSSMHANFFVNRGKGTADDFLTLMDRVSALVKERFQVNLEPEIRILGKG